MQRCHDVKFLRKHLDFVIFTASIMIFLVATTWQQRMRMTPPQDALWQIPSAAKLIGNRQYGFPENWGIQIGDLFFPVVTGPYLGAFKSYLLSLFMLTFGNFELASYLLNTFLTVLLVVLIYYVARKHFGHSYGMLAVAFVLLQNGFLYSSMMDYGPFLIGSICLTLSLASFSKWYQSKKAVELFLGLTFASIALGDKLTVIPFITPLMVWVVLTVFSNKRQFKLRQSSIGALVLVLPMIPFCWYFLTNGLDELRGWLGPSSGLKLSSLSWESYRALLSTLVSSLNGGSRPYLLMAISGESQGKVSNFFLIFFMALIFVPIVLRYLIFIRKLKIEREFFLSIQIYFTPFTMFLFMFVNYRPWHLNVFLPLLTFQFLSIVKMLTILWPITTLRRDKFQLAVRRNLLNSILISLVIVNSLSYMNTTKSLTGFAISSPVIRDASNYLSEKRFEGYICLVYSICNSLIATSTSHSQVVKADFAFSEKYSASPGDTLSEILGCSDVIVTMEIDKIRAQNQDQAYINFLTKNSESFYSNNLDDSMGLRRIYSKSLDGTSIQLWELAQGCTAAR